MRETKPSCCDGGGLKDEAFHFLGLCYVFDVIRANQIVRDGREPIELEEESTRYSVETSDLTEEHIAHVDPTRPGIIAHVKYTTAEGETIHGHVLIDGNHRAARCLELNRPFFVYLLSEEESEAILMRRPEQGELDAAVVPAPAVSL